VRGALSTITKTVRGEFHKREQPPWLEAALARPDLVRAARGRAGCCGQVGAWVPRFESS
jgi:hypothetical protein